MNTLPLTLNRVLEAGLGGETWQQFVDHYDEKYNQLDIEGFEFDPMRLDYTFSQLIANVGAISLPAYVDPESPGYEAALKELEGITGNIPTFKKYYRLNRVVVRQQMQLLQRMGQSALDDDMKNVFMSLLDEGTDGLIGSYYNALTHQRHQVVSTAGMFTIDNINNPRGVKGIVIDMGNASHRTALSGTNRWWTAEEHIPANEGAASDPIETMKAKVKEIRRKHHFVGRIAMEISQDLYDDVATHSKVLTRVGHYLYPNVTDDATVMANAKNASDDQIWDIIKRLIKVDAVKARDSWAYVDEPGVNADGERDLVTRQVENFKTTNIAFVPDGKIGTIQGVEPLTLGYEADKVASYDGGRLKLMQRAIAETHSIYIESEAAQLCVPSMPQFMFAITVTA